MPTCKQTSSLPLACKQTHTKQQEELRQVEPKPQWDLLNISLCFYWPVRSVGDVQCVCVRVRVCSYSICVSICADLNCIHLCCLFLFLYFCLSVYVGVWLGLTACGSDGLSRQCSEESLWPATINSSGLDDAPENRRVTWWFWQGGEFTSSKEKKYIWKKLNSKWNSWIIWNTHIHFVRQHCALLGTLAYNGSASLVLDLFV